MVGKNKNPIKPILLLLLMVWETILLQKIVAATEVKVKSKSKPPANVASKSSTKVQGRTRPTAITVVTGGSELSGEKRAWFHLGKVKNRTSLEEAENYLQSTFPEKHDSKGVNCSIKLGVDFELIDKILEH